MQFTIGDFVKLRQKNQYFRHKRGSFRQFFVKKQSFGTYRLHIVSLSGDTIKLELQYVINVVNSANTIINKPGAQLAC